MHSITQQIPTNQLNIYHLVPALGYYLSTNSTNPKMGIN